MKEIHFLGRRACLSVCYVFSFQATLVSEVRSKALRKPYNVLTLNKIRPDDPLYARPTEGWLRPSDDEEEEKEEKEEGRVKGGYNFGEFYNF